MSNTSLLGSYGGLGSSGLTFRNILINGEVTRINQRGFGGNWAALSVGEYGYDRWKKAGTDTMSQVVEEGNFIPGAQYTLSGTNVTTQTLTAPASGHWTITVQQTARFVMLEAGPVATPFEHRPYGLELQLCQRYYETGETFAGFFSSSAHITVPFQVAKRRNPTISSTVNVSFTGSASGTIAYTTTGNPLSPSPYKFILQNTTNNAIGATWRADAEL